eukprot:2301851-Alexandrium_andersonii.AAC.1
MRGSVARAVGDHSSTEPRHRGAAEWSPARRRSSAARAERSCSPPATQPSPPSPEGSTGPTHCGDQEDDAPY